METPEEIRRALKARQSGRQIPIALPVDAPPPPRQVSAPPPPQPAPPSTTAPFRPTARPPVALLVVCDDGKKSGEVVRLRSDLFVIGRNEGDLQLPHDLGVSARHVEIRRGRAADGRYVWTVVDLKTRNGLFVRSSRINLADGAEFLVGRGRYRFEAPGLDAVVADNAPTDVTRPWEANLPTFKPAVLSEVKSGGVAARFPLTADDYWIGRDPTCAVCRADDPFVEPRHARLRRHSGEWVVTHAKSVNGVWLMVPQITVSDACSFQIGEQRFRLTVPK
jgi:pSer/pThr/pTyr-binding forkhead associated (FHA) protein